VRGASAWKAGEREPREQHLYDTLVLMRECAVSYVIHVTARRFSLLAHTSVDGEVFGECWVNRFNLPGRCTSPDLGTLMIRTDSEGILDLYTLVFSLAQYVAKES